MNFSEALAEMYQGRTIQHTASNTYYRIANNRVQNSADGQNWHTTSLAVDDAIAAHWDLASLNFTFEQALEGAKQGKRYKSTVTGETLEWDGTKYVPETLKLQSFQNKWIEWTGPQYWTVEINSIWDKSKSLYHLWTNSKGEPLTRGIDHETCAATRYITLVEAEQAYARWHNAYGSAQDTPLYRKHY